MSSVKEIIGYVKNRRGEAGILHKNILGHDDPNVMGMCLTSIEVADQFDGQHWRSDKALDKPEQVFPGHSVAVIPTRGSSGVIIDFTNSERTILGSVDDINDSNNVSGILEETTGFSGWCRR